MASYRFKTINGFEMPFGQQCAYCGSDRALPEALFQSTNRDFFSGYKGNILHDWIIYDPRELVNLVDQYATEDGIAFDPAVRSASASSVIDEKVRAAYVMRSEEHTSELQSLMRSSYAVFCLKNKIQHYLGITKSVDTNSVQPSRPHLHT